MGRRVTLRCGGSAADILFPDRFLKLLTLQICRVVHCCYTTVVTRSVWHTAKLGIGRKTAHKPSRQRGVIYRSFCLIQLIFDEIMQPEKGPHTAHTRHGHHTCFKQLSRWQGGITKSPRLEMAGWAAGVSWIVAALSDWPDQMLALRAWEWCSSSVVAALEVKPGCGWVALCSAVPGVASFTPSQTCTDAETAQGGMAMLPAGT